MYANWTLGSQPWQITACINPTRFSHRESITYHAYLTRSGFANMHEATSHHSNPNHRFTKHESTTHIHCQKTCASHILATSCQDMMLNFGVCRPLCIVLCPNDNKHVRVPCYPQLLHTHKTTTNSIPFQLTTDIATDITLLYYDMHTGLQHKHIYLLNMYECLR